jgi:uncharacterized protein
MPTRSSGRGGGGPQGSGDAERLSRTVPTLRVEDRCDVVSGMGGLFTLVGSVPIWEDLLLLAVVALVAGLLGSLVGVGGGLILVPALVLLFGVELHLAIAASLVAVTANSCGAASTFVEEGLTNLRTGMFLETATAVGGLAGAVVAVTFLATHDNLLALAFLPVILVALVLMLRQPSTGTDDAAAPDWLARRLRLEGEYVARATGQPAQYHVSRAGLGLGLAGISGFFAGLLGVGGGGLNVPAMNSVMNMPLRPAAATSTFMIGVTASAGALVFLFAGDLQLFLAAPIALGSVVGSYAGSIFQDRATAGRLRGILLGVLVFASVVMAARALGYLG